MVKIWKNVNKIFQVFQFHFCPLAKHVNTSVGYWVLLTWKPLSTRIYHPYPFSQVLSRPSVRMFACGIYNPLCREVRCTFPFWGRTAYSTSVTQKKINTYQYCYYRLTTIFQTTLQAVLISLELSWLFSIQAMNITKCMGNVIHCSKQVF